MRSTLSRVEAAILLFVIAGLAWVSVWQHQSLQAIQLKQQKAHYAVRLQTAHRILEDAMLRTAYFTAIDKNTRHLARHYLEHTPK